jgi:hypothetical protein
VREVADEAKTLSGHLEQERALRAASDQISLAMQDSMASVEALGMSLARVAQLLAADLRAPGAAEQLQDLRREMGRAVTGLQFYDRMTQHLTHVQTFLAASAEQIGRGDAVAKDSWQRLERNLADRLLSDTHRIHLGQHLQAEFVAGRAGTRSERGASSPGDIDLF